MGKLLDIASAVFCIGAGIYLLQYNAVAGTDGTSWFQIIGHGMGIYFIGKGLFVGRSLQLQTQSGERLRRIAKAADGLDDEPEAKPVQAF